MAAVIPVNLAVQIADRGRNKTAGEVSLAADLDARYRGALSGSSSQVIILRGNPKELLKKRPRLHLNSRSSSMPKRDKATASSTTPDKQ